MSWSQEKTVEFIEEYRQNSVLWDINLPDYKNNNVKLDKLRDLAGKFNCDVQIVKKKIKNLRTAFRREHKVLTQRKSGSSPIKRSKWFAYDLLQFLLDVDSPRPGYSSERHPHADQPMFLEDEPGSDIDAESPGTSSGLNTEVAESSQEVERGDKKGKGPSNKIKGNSCKRKSVDEERAEEAYKILKNSVARDDSTIYGEHVACEIRKLDLKAQTIVKHKINNVLFEAAMGKYGNLDNSHQFGLPTPHPFYTSDSSIHHNPIASHSYTPTRNHSFYCGSSTPHDYDQGASGSISTSGLMSHPGNQSQQSFITSDSTDSQGFVAQSDISYDPHIGQAGIQSDQHYNETVKEEYLESLDILGRYSEYI